MQTGEAQSIMHWRSLSLIRLADWLHDPRCFGSNALSPSAEARSTESQQSRLGEAASVLHVPENNFSVQASLNDFLALLFAIVCLVIVSFCMISSTDVALRFRTRCRIPWAEAGSETPHSTPWRQYDTQDASGHSELASAF
jgi:hypothetical protein